MVAMLLLWNGFLLAVVFSAKCRVTFTNLLVLYGCSLRLSLYVNSFKLFPPLPVSNELHDGEG